MEHLRYETLMLAIPEITKDEAAALEKNIEKIVKDSKGNLISFERWGKYRLSYPIRHHDYGVYFLARFEATADKAGQLVHAVTELFKLKYNELVMRDMTTCLETEGLAYVKPDSLEDAPARDVDSFVRENKVDGIVAKDEVDIDMDSDEDEGEE